MSAHPEHRSICKSHLLHDHFNSRLLVQEGAHHSPLTRFHYQYHPFFYRLLPNRHLHTIRKSTRAVANVCPAGKMVAQPQRQ